MASVEFAPESFDAVLAFYSLTHLPKSEHASMIERLARWLRPGGQFLASFGAAEGEWSEEWLGTTMFFTHHHPEMTKRLVQDAGLRLQRVEMLKQDNEEAVFLWITAHSWSASDPGASNLATALTAPARRLPAAARLHVAALPLRPPLDLPNAAPSQRKP
jgi:SAM-dependent methyltransferase